MPTAKLAKSALSKFLDPIKDETFTSWFYRCATRPNAFNMLKDLENFCTHTINTSETSGAIENDYDFGFGDIKFSDLCLDNNLDKDKVAAHFTPLFRHSALILATYSRYAYCKACIYNDLNTIGFPCWRKTWCYVCTPFCPIHKIQLSSLYEHVVINDAHKPWYAFKQTSNLDFPLDSGSRHDECVPTSLLDNLGYRVQKFLMSSFRKRSVALPRFGIEITAQQFIHFVRVMLCTFLAVGNTRRTAGCALRSFLTTRTNHYHWIADQSACLKVGATTASPCHRIVALIVFGWLIGIISDKQYRLLARSARDHIRWVAEDLMALGCSIPTLHGHIEYLKYANEFLIMPLPLRESLEPFFLGAGMCTGKEMENGVVPYGFDERRFN